MNKKQEEEKLINELLEHSDELDKQLMDSMEVDNTPLESLDSLAMEIYTPSSKPSKNTTREPIPTVFNTDQLISDYCEIRDMLISTIRQSKKLLGGISSAMIKAKPDLIGVVCTCHNSIQKSGKLLMEMHKNIMEMQTLSSPPPINGNQKAENITNNVILTSLDDILRKMKGE